METTYLWDIHYSKNLIILKFEKRKIHIRNYDLEQLKEFLVSYINRYTYDIGVLHSLPITNKKQIGYLRLVYSPFYEWKNGKEIEKQLTGDTENDTITLFNQHNKPVFTFRGDDKLLGFLYRILDENLYENYNNNISKLPNYETD
jgi:hypothetical protein